MEQRPKSRLWNVVFVAVAVAATLWMVKGCQQPPIAVGRWFTAGDRQCAVVFSWTGKRRLLEVVYLDGTSQTLIEGDKSLQPGVIFQDGSPLVVAYRYRKDGPPADVTVYDIEDGSTTSLDASGVAVLVQVAGGDILAAKSVDRENGLAGGLVVLAPDGAERRTIETKGFTRVHVNRDATVLVLEGADGSDTRVLDYKTGQLMFELKHPSARPSPDGSLFVAGTLDGKTVHLYRGEQKLGSYELKNANLSQSGIEFSPDMQWVALSDGEAIHLLRMDPYGQVATVNSPEGYQFHALSFRVMSEGRILALAHKLGSQNPELLVAMYDARGQRTWQQNFPASPEGIVPGWAMGVCAEEKVVHLYLHGDVVHLDGGSGATLTDWKPEKAAP